MADTLNDVDGSPRDTWPQDRIGGSRHAHDWAVMLIWPNGARQLHNRGTEKSAREMVDWHNNSGKSACTARVVSRLVTTTYCDWLPEPAAPGLRCKVCRERGRAHLRMYRLCRLEGAEARRHPVEHADQVTSMNDARAALCMTMGVRTEHIDPVSGHDRTPFHLAVGEQLSLLDVAS